LYAILISNPKDEDLKPLRRENDILKSNPQVGKSENLISTFSVGKLEMEISNLSVVKCAILIADPWVDKKYMKISNPWKTGDFKIKSLSRKIEISISNPLSRAK